MDNLIQRIYDASWHNESIVQIARVLKAIESAGLFIVDPSDVWVPTEHHQKTKTPEVLGKPAIKEKS